MSSPGSDDLDFVFTRTRTGLLRSNSTDDLIWSFSPRESPASADLSFSDDSMHRPINFRLFTDNKRSNAHTSNSSVDLQSSDDSMHRPINFTTEPLHGVLSSPVAFPADHSYLMEIQHCMTCKTSLDLINTGMCGHTFCRHCISKQKCFKCQQEDFSSVRTEHSFAESGDMVCDYCLETKYKAVKYCFECAVQLCESHTRWHFITPALQEHTLTEVDGKPEQMFCQQHNRTLEVFCKTDQMHICKVCAGEEHKGHDKVYRILRKPASSYISTLLGRISADELRSFIQELSNDYPDCLGNQLEDLDASEVVTKLLKSFGEDGALKITLQYQQGMGQSAMAVNATWASPSSLRYPTIRTIRTTPTTRTIRTTPTTRTIPTHTIPHFGFIQPSFTPTSTHPTPPSPPLLNRTSPPLYRTSPLLYLRNSPSLLPENLPSPQQNLPSTLQNLSSPLPHNLPFSSTSEPPLPSTEPPLLLYHNTPPHRQRRRHIRHFHLPTQK